MSEADQTLKRLFALDEPGRDDPVFTLECARRIQARRYWFELAAGVPWLIAACAALWGLAPWIALISQSLANVLAVFVPASALALAVVFFAAPRAGRL